MGAHGRVTVSAVFGIIRPCRHRLSPRLRTSWWAHLCGLCLTLRDEHGQFARAATNYDGLIISALVEAQSPAGEDRRSAGPCPLRGMRSAAVSIGPGARLAAAASLVLASAKVRDHVEDGDGVFGRRPVAGVGRVVARRWAQQGAGTARTVGFDTAVLLDAVGRQSTVEGAAGAGDLPAVTEPTETATAAACAHTAVLAGRPANVAPLREVGRLFGRVVHLVDAVEDLGDGAWNPLPATGASLAEARRLCDDAVLGVRLALAEAEFRDPALVHALLVHELERAVERAFAVKPSLPGHEGPPDGAGGGCWVPKFRVPARRRAMLDGCGVALYMCGSCQICCRDPHPGPWSGRPRGAWCDVCDCCDCCDCCGSGDKGDGCDCPCDCSP